MSEFDQWNELEHRLQQDRESAVCPRCGRLIPLLMDGTLSCHMAGPDGRWECKASETWPDKRSGW